MPCLYKWDVVFKDVCGTGDGYGDNRTACFFCDFKTAFLKRQHLLIGAVSCALRENKDGNAAFDKIDTCENCFQSILDIGAVDEQAVQPFHPDREQRDMVHRIFGDITGQARTAAVRADDVKVTAVIGDIEDRFVCRDIFFADDGHFGSGHEQDKTEYPLYKAQLM